MTSLRFFVCLFFVWLVGFLFVCFFKYWQVPAVIKHSVSSKSLMSQFPGWQVLAGLSSACSHL